MRAPREYQLPDDILQAAATTAVVGYWVGTGVGFIQAGISLDSFFSGILLRDAAIGVLAASSIGILYPIVTWLIAAVRHCRHSISIEPATDPALEYQKIFYRLSFSRFYSWDIRVFLASQAVAILGAVIATNVGPQEQRMMGDFIGRSIGSMVGAIIGLVFPAILIRYCVNRISVVETGRIAERKWFNESRHDVPFFTRLFFGAWTGYVALSVLSTPRDSGGLIDVDKFNRDRLIGTVLSTIITFLSPTFFALLQKSLKKFDLLQNVSNVNPTFEPVSYYCGTRMDIPWYVRLFGGVLASATVGLVMAAYHGEDYINKNLVYVAGAFAMASPFIFSLLDQLLQRYFPQERLDAPAPLKLSFDMPWYARAGFAALAGAMIGDALRYACGIDTPSSVLPVITTGVSLSLAMITPVLMAGFHELGFSHPFFNPTNLEAVDLTWPWYSRLFAGLWLGAFVGTAFGNLCGNGSDVFITPGYIGPEFLSISNAYAAPTTALVFGVIGLIWPLVQCCWNKAQAQTLPEFLRCRGENEEAEPLTSAFAF